MANMSEVTGSRRETEAAGATDLRLSRFHPIVQLAFVVVVVGTPEAASKREGVCQELG